MTWPMFAELLIQFGVRGFDLAEKLIAKWSSNDPVTLADVEEARKLGERTPRQAMIEALNRAGIPLDSPQAVAMLALVPDSSPTVVVVPPDPVAPDAGSGAAPVP